MKTIDCLDSSKLINFFDGNLAEPEANEISIHLESCERCSKNYQLLKQLDEALFMENKKVRRIGLENSKTEACIDDDLLYRYLDGRTTEAETEKIEKHLDSCESCLNKVASIIANAHTPATETEQAEIAAMRRITPEEQVMKILEYCDQSPNQDKGIKIAAIVKQKVKEFFEKWIYTRYVWRPAIAFAVLVFIMVGVRQEINNYIADKQIFQAESILAKSYKVPKGNARLSGGFGPSGISNLLAPGEEKLSYVAEAKSKLNRAIKKSSHLLKARQILAKAYIIEKQISKADSIFLLLEAEEDKSAFLLNDIGVLYFHKNDWKQAAYYFQSAVKIDENLLEAYYNLALAKNNLGQFEEAITILNNYLKIEHDENWIRFASQLKSEIKLKLEELK